MQQTRRRLGSRRKRSTRWIILAIVMCSCVSCLAPVLYASTDCSRWLAEYKQGILQRRATRRLRAAKFRLTAMVHKPAPPHRYPTRHRMGPLESLRRFQIDCGDLDETPAPTPSPTPVHEAMVPPLPVEPALPLVRFPEAPPELPAPGDVLVATADVPPLINVPLLPVETVPISSVAPEPSSWMLVLTGSFGVLGLLTRRSKRNLSQTAV